ncbi:unnamed protein product [Ilex paraguariensis]|uniref:Uncharacterized protein n=1 Tax=Ilex paraguariensis TaxID=185542 RepID=A0ABC8RBQ4_9AQUA
MKIRVTIEESLNVPVPDVGRNENIHVLDVGRNGRTTGISYTQNMQLDDFNKRLSTVEIALSAFLSDHEALSAKFTFELNEIKEMLETLSKKVYTNGREPPTKECGHVVDGLCLHITDVSDEVRNAIWNYIFHDRITADEKIVQFDKFHARRMSMKSLRPRLWL